MHFPMLTETMILLGVSILAISRKNEMIHSVGPDERILQHDLVYISGDSEHTERFFEAIH